MSQKQMVLIVVLTIHVILFYTPTAAKFLKIIRKGSIADNLGFEIVTVNEETATVSVFLKKTPMNIDVYYSKNLNKNYSSPYDEWDPDKGLEYWNTHSNHIEATNPLIITHIITGFYKFESDSGGKAAYYYIDTKFKEVEPLQLPVGDKLFLGGYIRDENNRWYLRVMLPTQVQRVTYKFKNGTHKIEGKCPEIDKDGDSFIYFCDLSNQFLNNTQVLVKLEDVRCNQNSIWYHNHSQTCKMIYPVPNLEDPSIKHIDDDVSLPNIWIFGALCLMLVVIIICLVLFIQRRRQRTQLPFGTRTVLCFDCVSIGSFTSASTSLPSEMDTRKIEIKEDDSKHDVNLLLWYPRDCEPFMDLMKEFREYLIKCKGYQVVDLYEEQILAQARELGLNRWVSQALGQVANNGHVLLIWSPCAQHIYTRIKPMGSIYRYPRWTDQAFLLGLAALQPNSSNVDIIHITIESMSADPPLFLGSQYLNFELPGHLSLLMTHLGGPGQTESECDSDDDLLENQPNCLRIIQQTNSLKQFLKDKRSYLKELLEIES